NLMAMVREKAFQIQGKTAPLLQAPEAPRLLPVQTPSAISWQGSAGASGYDVERAQSKSGPWRTVAYNLSDARLQYRPLFNDEKINIGESYFYRVRARNAAGISEPGNIEGPVKATHKMLIDEFQNESLLFHKQGELRLVQNEARRYKEDVHRLHGEDGAWILYKSPAPMIGFAAYAFPIKEQSSLVISISNNGRTFETIEPKVINYSSEEGEYGYFDPVLYTASFNAQFLKIEFKGNVALSRVEIGYAK
ncbi:fibronectin type III domain-containing protein, partial [bacterium]|nr:fibronectin type III domain-containing protein [bacterium]